MNKVLVFAVVIASIFALSLGIAKVLEISSDIENKIIILPIKGIIISEDADLFLFSEDATSSTKILKQLESIENDNSIKAVIIEINSPGGTAVASKEIADKISQLKKPSVALIREVGASGGYWIASATDYIIADELSITGSIGVIGSYLEFSGLFEKYGIGYERLIAGEYKDIGTPYRKLTTKEKDLLQKKLDIIHAKFIKDVAANRNMPVENITKYANGIYYTGIEAYGLGLVDSLGNKQNAVEKAKELANLKNARIIESKETKSLVEVLSNLLNKMAFYVGKGISSTLVQGRFSIEA